MARYDLLLTLGLAASVSPKIAFSQKNLTGSPTREADRIHLAFTNKPASSVIRQQYSSGSLSLEALLENLRLSPDFQDWLAHFWLEKMGIMAPVEPFDIEPADGQGMLERLEKDRQWDNRVLRIQNHIGCQEFKDDPNYPWDAGDYYSIRLPMSASSNAERDTIEEVDCMCTNFDWHEQGNIQTNHWHTGRSLLSNPRWGQFIKKVNPWWLFGGSVWACSALEEPEICGPGLANCYPGDGGTSRGDTNTYTGRLTEDITQEPGIHVAKVVIDRRSWSETVASTQGVYTGVMGDFIAKWGSFVVDAAPPMTFRSSNLQLKLTHLDRTDNQWHWYDRGAQHAGALTTISYQRSHNGWRSLAKNALKAFLCTDFVVPQNQIPVESDETDLTKKPYCNTCHIVLEPMAQFFGNWPNTGDLNYLYDAGADSTGAFAGQSGSGAPALGSIFANLKSFQTCGIRRAFEFLHRRPMSSSEVSLMMPELERVYEQTSGDMWSIMVALAKMPMLYQGAWPDETP
jgi:hypothetical protein